MNQATLINSLRALVGEAHVLLNDQDRARYEEDATQQYHSRALAVVRPASTQEVASVMKLAYETRTPVVPIGGNTGLSGGAWAGIDGEALLLSLERMNQIRAMKPDARVVIAEAGVILDQLHQQAAAHDLVFPLIFGARGSCMLGGNLSTNAGGSNVLRYGNVRDLCLGLEVVLPNGEVLDLLSELHKDNSGYDLKDLFIGAEGTLGVITAAVFKLFPQPKAYATAMVALKDLPSALQLLNRLQESSGGAVEAFEYMPKAYMQNLLLRFPNMRPPFEAPQEVNVLVEVGATAERDAKSLRDGSIPIVNQLERNLMEFMESGLVLDAALAKSEQQRAEMWARREAAYEVMMLKKPLIMTDVAVPLDRVSLFLEQMAQRLPLLHSSAEAVTVAHLGDGNIHYGVWPDPQGLLEKAALKLLHEQIVNAVEETALSLGGSFSAEHGIGVYKKSAMSRYKDPVTLQLMRQLKEVFDPVNIMNPGKLLPE